MRRTNTASASSLRPPHTIYHSPWRDGSLEFKNHNHEATRSELISVFQAQGRYALRKIRYSNAGLTTYKTTHGKVFPLLGQMNEVLCL